MKNLDCFSDVSLEKAYKVFTNKLHEYFLLLGYCEFILHYIKASLLWKNKKSTSLHTNDETIIVRCFAGFFCIFVLLTSSSLYLSLEICFPGICLMFYLSIFDVTLNLCFLVSFSEIFFLERSRYLFNNAYVRSSLVIMYPYQ